MDNCCIPWFRTKIKYALQNIRLYFEFNFKFCSFIFLANKPNLESPIVILKERMKTFPNS